MAISCTLAVTIDYVVCLQLSWFQFGVQSTSVIILYGVNIIGRVHHESLVDSLNQKVCCFVELKGKNAIVTGGAVRIGRQLAVSLAQAGMNIGLHYGNSVTEAEKVSREISDLGVNVVAIKADFSQPMRSDQSLVDQAAEKLGPISVLINNAAIFEEDQLATVTGDHWDKHFDINLKSPFFLSQAFANQLASNQTGHIVNIVDWRAIRPGCDHLVYTMTKSALLTMTKSLAQHLAPNVRVNAIAPGAILPPPNSSDAEWRKVAVERNPLEQIGNPSDVADAMLFLLKSQFITGEVIQVAGGESL